MYVDAVTVTISMGHITALSAYKCLCQEGMSFHWVSFHCHAAPGANTMLISVNALQSNTQQAGKALPQQSERSCGLQHAALRDTGSCRHAMRMQAGVVSLACLWAACLAQKAFWPAQGLGRVLRVAHLHACQRQRGAMLCCGLHNSIIPVQHHLAV